MRRLVSALAVAATFAAAPALALTISPAPNRDQAAHLKQTSRSGDGSIDPRDTFAGAGRPFAGSEFSGAGGPYRQTQSYRFGDVTTSVTIDRDPFQPDLIDRRR